MNRPVSVMGVVNANPDSFSDSGESKSLKAVTEHVDTLVEAGADTIDVGGESAATQRDQVAVSSEINRVLPVVKYITENHSSVTVSVDTYKPQVVDAVLDAGADIVNDVSGLLYPENAALCAQAGARLVLMHTSAKPKVRLQQDDLYPDGVTNQVEGFLLAKVREAQEQGMQREQLILDPGPDFTKTPWQTVEVLRDIDRLVATGIPVLAAISRKDFIGAVLKQLPKERLVGTLAAVAYCYDHGCKIFRVHDVKAVADFILMYQLLKDEVQIDRDLRIGDSLRHQTDSPTGSQVTN